jgi:hypothetical protein
MVTVDPLGGETLPNVIAVGEDRVGSSQELARMQKARTAARQVTSL